MNPQERARRFVRKGTFAGDRERWLAVVLALGFAVGACGPPHPAPHPLTEGDGGSPAELPPPPQQATPAVPKTLYDRLGGKEGVGQLIEAFVQKLYGEKRLNRAFAKLKKDAARDTKFREMLAEQLCAETGGGCTYAGKEMKIAHKGLRITNAEWHVFIEKFTEILVERKVEEDDQSEIFSMLGKMQKEVVLK